MLKYKSFIRLLFAGVLLIMLSLSVSTSSHVAAGTPTSPLPAGFENWSGSFTLKSSVPFVWVRSTPSSIAQVLITLYRGSVFVPSATARGDTLSWDGVQWWGYFALPTLNVTGWVELASLERVAAATSTPPPQAGPREAWKTSTALRVKKQIPYVWVRAAPDSYGDILFTVASLGSLTVSSENAVLDGRQWWWLVKNPSSGVTGWVEQTSLELASGATENPRPTVQPWAIGAKVRIKPTIPFSWLRNTYSSWAGAIYTAVSGQLLEVAASPQFDGIQWWWKVKVPNSQTSGWVEQNSLVAEPAQSATSAPQPSLSPNEYTLVQQQAAFETFERGFMIWLSGDDTIYVMLYKGRQVVKGQFTYQWFEYAKADYINLPDNPFPDPVPSGMTKPIRGFGKVWGNIQQVRDVLGWATAPEQGYTTTMKFPKALLRYFLMTLPDNREILVAKHTAIQFWDYQTP